MNARIGLTVAVLLSLAGCKDSQTTSTPADTPHTYLGTASAGDLVTITVDHAAGTIHWENAATLGSGTASFTVAADGALVVADAAAEIQKAYELPGYALAARDIKAVDGSHHSPLFAWEKVAATRAEFAGLTSTWLQFRGSGGFEVGCGTVSATGNQLVTSSFMPAEALAGGNTFSGTTLGTLLHSLPGDLTGLNAILLTDRSDGTVLFQPYKNGVADGPGGALFKVGEGWAVDLPGGAVFLIDAPATQAWSAASAGTYHLIGWKVTGVTASSPGTAGFLEVTVTLDALGGATFTDPGGGAPSTRTFVPFNMDGAMHGPGLVELACNGLFVSGTPSDKSFLAVSGRSLFLSGLKTSMPGGVLTHEYAYGVGLKVP
jgi:hypothetical protein